MGDDVPAVQNDNETTQPMPAVAPAAAPRPTWRALAVPVVCALVIGVGAGYALNEVTSDGGSASGGRGFPMAANGGGLPSFGGQGGAGRQGRGNGMQGAPSRGGFGVAGEEHVQGTVAAKTASTITVKAAGGTTTTYAVGSSSQIVVDGQPGTLADVKVGEIVFLHAVPASSGDGKVIERLFAGSPPQGAPGDGGPPRGQTF